MPDQRRRSLSILATAQAATSGLTALVIFALYGLRPADLTDTTVSLTAAILGTAALVYFATIHQILKRGRPGLSTLILTFISTANIILVITATGGLDSPYYSLWLLAIVVAGLFGTTETLAVLSLTLAYYTYSIVAEGFHTPYLRDHLIQLAITFIAGGLAQWVHLRARGSSATNGSSLTTLSGQLPAEQLKADAIMASIGEGVMVIDATRRIQLFNQAAQNLSGWDEASAQNIDAGVVLQLKTADDQALTEATDPFVEAWKKQAIIVRDNLVMTSRAGHKTQLSLSVSPIFGPNHQPSGAIALFRDISQEKEMERQKDEFISTASHEMRTPVAAIEGYIALAMNSNVATIDDRAKAYLEKAHVTIGHLGDLFRDLLSVTKAEEGNLAARIEAVNLGQLVQTAVDDMQFAATKQKLTLVFQVGAQSGKAIAPLYYVAANPERLREVVMNLIDNATKFTTEGGIKVILEGDNKEVEVDVADTGLGIAKEDIPHLFQKFYRIDSSATRTIGGTGLGLYLCRRVIELFNGRIWVESKPGQGSTFRFRLPRLSQDEAERMQAAAIITPGAGPADQETPAAPPATPTPPTPAPAMPPPATPAAAPASVVPIAKPPAAESPPVPTVNSVPGQPN